MKEQQRTAEARRRQQLSVVRVECGGGRGTLIEEKKDLERKALMAATGCSVSRNGMFVPFVGTPVLANERVLNEA